MGCLLVLVELYACFKQPPESFKYIGSRQHDITVCIIVFQLLPADCINSDVTQTSFCTTTMLSIFIFLVSLWTPAFLCEAIPLLSQSSEERILFEVPALTLSPFNDSVTPLIAAYYPDWTPASFPPSKIDFTRIDWVDFAFAVPDERFNLTWDDDTTAPNLLTELVSTAHVHGKKVKLSIGGWSGSKSVSFFILHVQCSL